MTPTRSVVLTLTALGVACDASPTAPEREPMTELPPDLAAVTFTTERRPTAPYALLEIRHPNGFLGFVVVDGAGRPVWYLRTEGSPSGATRRVDGNLVLMDSVSSVRRLPNGNTMIGFGLMQGLGDATDPIEVYEVTADGEVLWRGRWAGWWHPCTGRPRSSSSEPGSGRSDLGRSDCGAFEVQQHVITQPSKRHGHDPIHHLEGCGEAREAGDERLSRARRNQDSDASHSAQAEVRR